MRTTVVIDCDPWTGMGRQQDHYEACCKLINFSPEPRISASFGCWEWPIEYRNREERDKVKAYLTDLYNDNLCRYAAW